MIALDEWMRRIPEFRVRDGAIITAAGGGVIGIDTLPLVLERVGAATGRLWSNVTGRRSDVAEDFHDIGRRHCTAAVAKRLQAAA